MNFVIGIICLIASVVYGVSIYEQKSPAAKMLRALTTALFFTASVLWLLKENV